MAEHVHWKGRNQVKEESKTDFENSEEIIIEFVVELNHNQQDLFQIFYESMQLGHLFSRFFCRPLNVNFPEWMVVGKIVIVRSGHSDLDPRLARLLPEAADQEPEEASSQSEGVAEVPDEVCRKSGEPVGDADVVGELEDGCVALLSHHKLPVKALLSLS